MTSTVRRGVEFVERRIHELLDERAQVGDDARCERFLHEAAQARVVGRIGLEHRTRGDATRAAEHLLDAFREQRVVVLDADRRVAQHAVDVVVAQEQPRPERGLLHRLGLSQRGVDRVGVGEERRTEQFVRGDHRRTVACGSCPGPGSVWVTSVTPIEKTEISRNSRPVCDVMYT